MNRPALRHGGVPLMAAHTPWPRCARCNRPMRFRAQVPLAVTLVAPPDDPRLLLVFECRGDEGCGRAHALLVSGPLAPRKPERPSRADLAPHGARLVFESAEEEPPEGAIWASVGPEEGGERPQRCPRGHRLRSAVRLWPQRLGEETLHAVRVALCTRCGATLAQVE